MKKRKIVVTGGLLTSMLLAGVAPLYAQTIPLSKSSSKTEDRQEPVDVYYDQSSRPDMADFGIEAQEMNDYVLIESSRQILIEEGFSPSQVYKIVNSAKKTVPKNKNSLYDME